MNIVFLLLAGLLVGWYMEPTLKKLASFFFALFHIRAFKRNYALLPSTKLHMTTRTDTKTTVLVEHILIFVETSAKKLAEMKDHLQDINIEGKETTTLLAEMVNYLSMKRTNDVQNLMDEVAAGKATFLKADGFSFLWDIADDLIVVDRGPKDKFILSANSDFISQYWRKKYTSWLKTHFIIEPLSETPNTEV